MSEEDLEIRGIHYIKHPRRQKIIAAITLFCCFIAFLIVWIFVMILYGVDDHSNVTLSAKSVNAFQEKVEVVSFSFIYTAKEGSKAKTYPEKKVYSRRQLKHYYQDDAEIAVEDDAEIESEENNSEGDVSQDSSSDDTQIVQDSVEGSAFDPEYRSSIEDKTQKIKALLESVDQKTIEEGESK